MTYKVILCVFPSEHKNNVHDLIRNACKTNPSIDFWEHVRVLDNMEFVECLNPEVRPVTEMIKAIREMQRGRLQTEKEVVARWVPLLQSGSRFEINLACSFLGHLADTLFGTNSYVVLLDGAGTVEITDTENQFLKKYADHLVVAINIHE